MALFTLIEKTVDFKALVNRLELLEGKITSAPNHEPSIDMADNALKKKTVLDLDRAPIKEIRNIHKENTVPSGNFNPVTVESDSAGFRDRKSVV